MRKKIGLLLVFVVLIGVGKYVYDMHINHNFETISDGKVYKSGAIPPDEIEGYIKNNNIKSICKLFHCAEWYEREAFDLFGRV